MKVLTLTLIVPVFLLGCGKKDPVAGLNELPAQSAANLKLVPDLHVLATRIDPTTVHPPEPFSTATLCGKDWSYTFFDAKITTPITVCTRPEARLANENNLLFPHRVFEVLRLFAQPITVPGQLRLSRSGRASALVRRKIL